MSLRLCTMLPPTEERRSATSMRLRASGSTSALIRVLTSAGLDRAPFALIPGLSDQTRSHANLPQDQGQENSATGRQPLGPA